MLSFHTKAAACLLCWIAVTAACGIFLRPQRLWDACRLPSGPDASTLSGAMDSILGAEFPELVPMDVESVLIRCEACETVLGSFAAAAIRELRTRCAELNASNPGILSNWTDHYDFMLPGRPRASPLLSRSGRGLLFTASWDRAARDRPTEALAVHEAIHDTVMELDARGRADSATPLTLTMTGGLTLWRAAVAAVHKDVVQGALIFPLALLCFFSHVRSLLLLAVPVLTLLTSYIVSFGCMAAFFAESGIPLLLPPVALFLNIALCVDYNLFLLSRFVEGLAGGREVPDVVDATMGTSGLVVAKSGLVLLLCFAGLLAFPDTIRLVGAGAMTCVAVCALVHLTLVPALLLSLSRGAFLGCSCGLAVAGSRCWRGYARVVTKRRGAVAVVSLALAAGAPLVARYLPTYPSQYVASVSSPANPRDNDASLSAAQIAADFALGDLEPTYIAVQAMGEDALDNMMYHSLGFGCSVRSNFYFGEMIQAADCLLKDLASFGVTAGDLRSIAWVPARPGDTSVKKVPCISPYKSYDICRDVCCINNDMAEQILEEADKPDGALAAKEYRDMFHRLITKDSCDAHSILVVTKVSWDPTGPKMDNFIMQLRESLEQSKSRFDAGCITPDFGEYSCTVDGIRSYAVINSFSPEYDLAMMTQSRFLAASMVVSSVVFAVVACMFRAPVVPLKMLLTISLPTLVVYSVTALVFEGGALDWTGVGPLRRSKIYWADLAVTFTPLLGLALDYDIFLFSRVVDLRFAGSPNAKAVRDALVLTGPTISTAGLIMSVSFAGLLVSEIPAHCQVGFILTFAVLLDTFFVRTCFLPAALTLAGDWNYWPRDPPWSVDDDGGDGRLLRA